MKDRYSETTRTFAQFVNHFAINLRYAIGFKSDYVQIINSNFNVMKKKGEMIMYQALDVRLFNFKAERRRELKN